MISMNLAEFFIIIVIIIIIILWFYIFIVQYESFYLLVYFHLRKFIRNVLPGLSIERDLLINEILKLK